MQNIDTNAIDQVSWDSYNQLLLYGDSGRLSKILSRYELYKMTIKIPGDIVEGGVFKGAGLLMWAKFIEIFNSKSDRRVVGFDTFQGFPAQNLDYETKFLKENNGGNAGISSSAEILSNTIVSQGLQSRVELIAGDVQTTLSQYTKDNPGFRIALLNVDFDTYTPTKTVLEELYDRVVRGGVVVFDEYAVRNWGESDAVDEFIKDRNIQLQSLPWTQSPTAFFVRE